MAALSVGMSCGDGLGPGRGTPGIRVIAGPTADSIDAEPALALTVEARDDDGALATGMTVRFESILVNAGDAWALVGALDQRFFTGFVAADADDRGRASAILRMGSVSGTARVRVGVPELGIADTVELTVLPGAPARARFNVRDTVMMIGRSFTLTATLTDRWLNPVPGTPSIVNATPAICSYASQVVTGDAMGRCEFEARHGEMRDTARATVLLLGRLAAVRSHSALSLVSTDGTEERQVITTSDASLAPAWSPDGSRLVIYEGDPGSGARLSILDTTGVRLLTIGAGTVMASAALGRFSPDGQWVYFSGTDGSTPTTIWRMRPDGTDRETIVMLSETFPFGIAWRPSVSPDGQTVAFDNGGRIGVVDVGTRQPTDLGVAGVSPAFSPDGQTIAFIGMPFRTLNVMNRNGTNVRVVSQDYHEEWQLPQWTSDGAFLLVNGSGLKFVNVADGSAMHLTGLPYSQATLKPPHGR